MNAIHSIFAVPANSPRVSFLTRKGEFAYKGLGYAYIIRPSRDGATATLRCSRKFLTTFLRAYWPKTMMPKFPDMVLADQGFGWWRVESLSEVGDKSVHQFFRYLNLWALARDAKQEKAAHPVEHRRTPRYQIIAESGFGRCRILGKVVPVVRSLAEPVQQVPVTSQVDPKKLAMLARVVNQRFGHLHA